MCPPPSSSLLEGIDHAGRRQPIYRIADGLRIPCLRWTAEAAHYAKSPESVGIRAEVAAHLDEEKAGAARVEASKRSRLQLARLTAAAHRDIGGGDTAGIAEYLGYSGDQSSRLRAVRRDAAGGRQLWVAVGAWPWWAVARATERHDLAGGVPVDWWKLPEVNETLTVWLG